MRVLVTGAGGFLGRSIVAAALREGHRVTAVVRSKGPITDDPRVEVVEADLNSSAGLEGLMRGVDAVIHAAMAKAGGSPGQHGATMRATENVLRAMEAAGVRRIVGISSLAVYDFTSMKEWSTLTEDSPIMSPERARDEYSRTKLEQEATIVSQARKNGWDYAIVRAGAVFGPGRLWTARLGIRESARFWILVGGAAPMPVVYVEHVAGAIVMAAGLPGPLALTVNAVDDSPPTQSSYAADVLGRLSPRPRSLTLPLAPVRAAARLASGINRGLFRGRARLPGLFVPECLDARFKPLRYSNQRLREVVGWRPGLTMSEALDRSIGTVDRSGRSSPAPGAPPAGGAATGARA